MQPDIVGALEDIREAIESIAEDTEGMSFDAFMQDRRTRQTVGWNFAIIGEAVNRLYRRAPDLAGRITAARQIVNFRNTIIHGYDVIDSETVWHIIHEAMPQLRADIDRILRDDGDATS